MTHGNGAIVVLWNERPPLAAANTTSIRQGGGNARAVAGKLLIGHAQSDSSLDAEMGRQLGVLNVSTHKPLPTDGCLSGVGVKMHRLGGQRVGGDTRTAQTSQPVDSCTTCWDYTAKLLGEIILRDRGINTNDIHELIANIDNKQKPRGSIKAS